MSDKIICPNCSFEIEVTEAIESQLRDELQKKFDAELRMREKEYVTRDKALQDKEAALDQEVAERLEAERDKLTQDALANAKKAVAVDLKDKEAELAETKSKLVEAQQAELELRKSKRELEEAKREQEVTVARKMDEEREKIREAAKKEAADERQLKEAEKDKLISDLRKQADDLTRKLEQGSQQTQGEVMELELEDVLRTQFPFDTIEPVPKGVHGGDVLQHVYDGGGYLCGTILWESKRTKAWSDGWLPKLRDDQRAAKAQFAVLASIEMPKGTSTFDCIDGTWVTNRACIVGIATALRAGLIEVANAKRGLEGRQDKMEILYNYLAGPEFRHRVEGIVEAFGTMRTDLEAEKRAVQKIWAKREKQLDRAITHTAGLHGDLTGIIGAAIPQIESLELLAITDSTQGEPDDAVEEEATN